MSDPEIQQAGVSVSAGPPARIDASVRATPRGLLATGGLVAAILLSAAALVRTALRESKA